MKGEKDEDGYYVAKVPIAAGMPYSGKREELGRGILRGIIKDAKISKEDFLKLLKRI